MNGLHKKELGDRTVWLDSDQRYSDENAGVGSSEQGRAGHRAKLTPEYGAMLGSSSFMLLESKHD